MALSGSAGTPHTHSLGLAKVHQRLRGVWAPLGFGNPTQTLNSGVVQWPLRLPKGTWGDLGQAAAHGV